MKTKERLAQDLEKAGAPTKMIEWARNGFYDDYETVIAFPIQQLVAADAQLSADRAELEKVVREIFDTLERSCINEFSGLALTRNELATIKSKYLKEENDG